MKTIQRYILVFAVLSVFGCSKKDDSGTPYVPPPKALKLLSAKLDDKEALISTQVRTQINNGINLTTTARLYFNNAVDRASVNSAVGFSDLSAVSLSPLISYENNDSVLVIKNTLAMQYLTPYTIGFKTSLKSVEGISPDSVKTIYFNTKIDSANKFPVISDAALLDTIQRRTFRYFWDFAHPVSGLARERSNGDNNLVTSGGSGFGIMAIPVAVNRNFITRAEGLARMQTIVSFLKNTAEKFHGAFPHWLNGSTGAVIPFSTKDNGADLVETSYLMAGLLTARQYFNTADAAEVALRDDINILYNNVEWDWFRNGGQNVLYWHWSPNYNWDMNVRIKGWNECLITYILAASSTTHSVPLSVYSQGWRSEGFNGFTNGNTFYGYFLPLGPDLGGPLFFSHYSFLGIDPFGLNDIRVNYETQTRNHTLINYSYCVDNPQNWYGYSDKTWGLTASDGFVEYSAYSPTNDRGIIAPTAALSSFPYTPAESMKALKLFYYTMGDKTFKQYGFVDAFSIHSNWFAQSFLAIDQGPIIVMIENYRSRLIWSLLTSCPEVQNGMRGLGFTAPYL
jgi:hypothetical protein